MLNILTFSTLFPNTAQPSHGIFVENRLRYLVATGQVRSTVVAPVPWLPVRHRIFGYQPDYGAVPHFERRHGLDIWHPRYIVIPKIGMSVAPILLALAAGREIARLVRSGLKFDLIDAHYFYPDGVAAVILGKWFNKPVVITGRGTDLNLIPQYALPRRQIQWAANRAAGMITVCNALKESLVDLGVDPGRVSALRNGVDLGAFRPGDRAMARAKFSLAGPTLASVGHLIDRKGHHHVIAALPAMPDYRLLIAGDGPDRAKLESQAHSLGVADRAYFLGNLKQPELRDLYEAADALVLASSREGWANVLLESMACGTPVVASNIWGTPEVVAERAAGVLMPELSSRGVVEGVRTLFANMPTREETRAYAEKFSWDETTQGQLHLFKRILQNTP